MNDINQGYLGDCYFLSSIAEVAKQDPGFISSMFTSNGNGTYGVRFYVNGTAEYVTVNSSLADGGSIFNDGPDIWASLAEKAYAQLQTSGAVTGNSISGNSWSAIGNGGAPECALEEITGASVITDFCANGRSWVAVVYNSFLHETSSVSGISTASVLSVLVSDLAKGDDLVLSSNTNATDSAGYQTLVADHALSIYGYDIGTGLLEIRNPWGSERGQYWDTTFEVGLSTLLSDGDTITADNGGISAGTATTVASAVTVFTFSHTSGGGGDWNTGANWAPAGTPIAGDTVLITAAGTYTVASSQANSVAILDMAAKATLAINGNTLDVTGGTGTGALAGKITVADAATLGFGTIAANATFNNTGTITLNSTGDATDLVISGNVTLAGAGKVTLSDNANNGIVSDGNTAMLTNGSATASNTISGAGTIGDAHLTLINNAKGVIDGNGIYNSLTLDTGANTITNAGTLDGATAQGLIVASAVGNSNLIEALGRNSLIAIEGNVVNTTKGIILASGTGAQVDLEGSTVTGGTFKTTGTNAAINVTGGGTSTLDGSGAGLPVNNAGNLAVSDDTTLRLKGTINNTNTVTLLAGADVTDLMISAAVLLAGSGHINLSGVNDAIVSDGSAAALTDGSATAGNTIAGLGTIGDSHLDIVNSAKGIVDASDAGGGMLIVDAASFSNAGILEATRHGVLLLESDVANTATGQMKALASGAHIDLDGATISGGAISTVAGSLIEATNAATASTISGAKVTNAGTLGAEGGDLTITGAVANTGNLDANGYHLAIDGAVTGAGKGTIEGTGILEFGLASSAKITFGPGATGQLWLDSATSVANKFTGTVTGFASGDHVDFGAIDYTTGNGQLKFVENAAHTSGVLTVSDGSHSEALTLMGNYVLADFNTQQDVNHHVDLLHV
jgi:hypothetical protein